LAGISRAVDQILVFSSYQVSGGWEHAIARDSKYRNSGCGYNRWVSPVLWMGYEVRGGIIPYDTFVGSGVMSY